MRLAIANLGQGLFGVQGRVVALCDSLRRLLGAVEWRGIQLLQAALAQIQRSSIGFVFAGVREGWAGNAVVWNASALLWVCMADEVELFKHCCRILLMVADG